MRVFRDLEQLPVFRNSVITIGTFDGVHKGHQKIIHRIKQLAQAGNGESIIITFHPHPRIVINPQDKTLKLLNTIEEKTALLESFGVDNLVVVPFSRSFSEQGAEDYISSFLIKNFSPSCIVIGYDHKFGKNRTGDFALLQKLSTTYGYKLEEISKETLDDIDISSTKIRQALMNGEVHLANELLGHSYTLSGNVVRGLQNGRKLGYPTANILVSDTYKLIPANGVYIVSVRWKNKTYPGMLNIGYNPTFNGTQQTIEVNLLDFNDDLYGENLTLELIHYIRPEMKFDSIDALIEAIKQDEVYTRRFLSEAGWIGLKGFGC